MLERFHTGRGGRAGHAGALHFPFELAGKYRNLVRWPRRHRRLVYLVILPICLLAVIVGAGSYVVDRPLRAYMEHTLNRKLKGHTARLPGVSFHPLGFSITLEGLTISQDAYPNPPVMEIRNLTAGVHWHELLHGALVADLLLDRPRVHADLTQLKAEARSKVKLKDRGWQDALQSIYPLKINRFRVREGEVTYIDRDPNRPLQLSHLNVLATNIRNIRSPNRVYPSVIHLEATIFDNGRLQLDGHANFLEEPNPGFDADVDLSHVQLDRVKPVAEHANLQVDAGILDAKGHIEDAPGVENLHLSNATLRGVEIEYIHKPQTETDEAERAAKAERVAKNVSNKANTLVLVDLLKIEESTIGYVDETKQPGYRVFVSDVDARIKNFSNQAAEGAAGLTLTGKFMGSGATNVDATFWPEQKELHLDVAARIENTQMAAMDKLFQAYGDFGVNGGLFSFYSELSLHNGTITGYLKPLFTDMSVADRRTEEQKSLFHQMYVGLVGGVADLLKNQRGTVATETSIEGPAANPKTSTWEAIIKLIQNAFFKSILPGFDRSIGEK